MIYDMTLSEQNQPISAQVGGALILLKMQWFIGLYRLKRIFNFKLSFAMILSWSWFNQLSSFLITSQVSFSSQLLCSWAYSHYPFFSRSELRTFFLSHRVSNLIIIDIGCKIVCILLLHNLSIFSILIKCSIW